MTTWVCTRQGELCHHGIKGRKWGVRRFQNKDGSLTPAGEKRYNDQTPHSNKTEKQYKIPKNKSLHRLKLEDKYKQQGFSKEEAEQKAAKRIKAEIYVAAAAAVTVASCVAYAKYKGYTNDKTLKSNTEFQRIMQLAENAEIREGRQYLSFDKNDKIKYKGLLGDGFNNNIQMRKGWGDSALKERVYDVTVRNKDDIKIASRKRAEDAFMKLYKEDSEFRANMYKRSKELQYQLPMLQGINDKLKNGNVKDSILRKHGYDLFNILLADHDNASVKNSNKFYDTLRKQGVNAVVDMNDKKYSGYRTKMPIIVFDGKFDYSKRVMETSEIISYNKKAQDLLVKPDLMKLGATYTGMLATVPIMTKANVDRHVLLYKDEHPNTKMTDSEIREMVKKELAKSQK